MDSPTPPHITLSQAECEAWQQQNPLDVCAWMTQDYREMGFIKKKGEEPMILAWKFKKRGKWWLWFGVLTLFLFLAGAYYFAFEKNLYYTIILFVGYALGFTFAKTLNA